MKKYKEKKEQIANDEPSPRKTYSSMGAFKKLLFRPPLFYKFPFSFFSLLLSRFHLFPNPHFSCLQIIPTKISALSLDKSHLGLRVLAGAPPCPPWPRRRLPLLSGHASTPFARSLPSPTDIAAADGGFARVNPPTSVTVACTCSPLSLACSLSLEHVSTHLVLINLKYVGYRVYN